MVRFSYSKLSGSRNEDLMNQGRKIGMIIAIVLVSLIFLAALTTAVLVGTGVLIWDGGLKFHFHSQEETEPTVSDPEPEVTEPTVAEPTVNGISYSGEEEEVIAVSADVVAKVGDMELTNGELQVYYWSAIYTDMYYLTYYLGVDFNKPLDQQVYDSQTGQSWQDAFLKQALLVWSQMAAVIQHAEDTGFTYDEEDLEYLNNLDAEIAKEVEEGQYESAESMLMEMFGPSVTVDDYKSYMTTYYCAQEYIRTLQESLVPTMEELETYYTENETMFKQNGVSKDMGSLMDVRHILIIPGDYDPEENVTTFTEEEWADALAEAQGLLDEWSTGEKTEESFAELAKLHSEDPGSVEKGGLYTDVYQGQMVAEFDAWVFDETREQGHYGLVKTSYGYHLMYFVEEHPIWINSVRQVYLNEKTNPIVQTAIDTYPSETYYDSILLGEPDIL